MDKDILLHQNGEVKEDDEFKSVIFKVDTSKPFTQISNDILEMGLPAEAILVYALIQKLGGVDGWQFTERGLLAAYNRGKGMTPASKGTTITKIRNGIRALEQVGILVRRNVYREGRRGSAGSQWVGFGSASDNPYGPMADDDVHRLYMENAALRSGFPEDFNYENMLLLAFSNFKAIVVIQRQKEGRKVETSTPKGVSVSKGQTQGTELNGTGARERKTPKTAEGVGRGKARRSRKAGPKPVEGRQRAEFTQEQEEAYAFLAEKGVLDCFRRSVRNGINRANGVGVMQAWQTPLTFEDDQLKYAAPALKRLYERFGDDTSLIDSLDWRNFVRTHVGRQANRWSYFLTEAIDRFLGERCGKAA